VGQVINVLAGLATTFIGYIIGRTWQKVIDRMPYRRARIFWQPLLNADTQIVVSRFELPSWPEPTGAVGGGDAIALREISSYFSRIGLRRTSVVYVDEPTVDRDNNLILLGGPGSNAVTMDALRLFNPQVQLLDPPGEPGQVHDLVTGKKYKAEADGARDYGAIIRARSPFNPERWLVIIAGIYGYGTWGGVKMTLENDDFLERCREREAEHGRTYPAGLQRLLKDLHIRHNRHKSRTNRQQWVGLECIFQVDVYDRRPYRPEVIVHRRIPPIPPNSG